MRLGRRLTPPTLSLATLVAVVMAMAALQYHWIGQVRDAEETRVRTQLREKLRRLSDAFDIEIARAVLAFTIAPDPEAAAYDQLGRSWQAWNRNAPWPRTVAGVALLESTGGNWRARPWGDPGAFDPASIPPPQVTIAVPSGSLRGAATVSTQTRIADAFLHGQPFLVRPLPVLWTSIGQPQMNYVLIHLDLDYLAGVLFPHLLEKYATAEERSEFRFAIEPKSSRAASALAAAGVFHYRPDCLLPMAGGAGTMTTTTVASGSVRSRASVTTRRFGAFPAAVTAGPVGLLPAVLHEAGECRMPVADASLGLMQLTVRRQPGALNDLYAGLRRRNEWLSGLLLLALVGALAALVLSTERARKLARFQTVVAAGISHELRTPLASLRIAVDDLKSGHVADVAQACRYGEILDAQSQRLCHVVDQALALTSLTQANAAASLRLVAVPEMLAAALETFAPRLSQAGIAVEQSIAPALPAILADPQMVLRCLTNLIENALKYAGSGGWIRLSAHAARHAGRAVVEVAVEDRGPGIAEEEAAGVFEPFYRGRSARRSRESGSGLGLAIVRNAVEAQGGWVVLERAVPRGCKFRLFFPAEAASRCPRR